MSNLQFTNDRRVCLAINIHVQGRPKNGPGLTAYNFHYRQRTIDQMVPLFAGNSCFITESVTSILSHLLNIFASSMTSRL